MKTPAGRRTSLLEALERLGPHDHLCLFYGTRKEQFAVALPFIRLGLERGERCIYVADDNTVEVILAACRGAGLDTESAMRSGALTLATKRDTYLREGKFDPDAMIRFLEEATDAALAAGFPALRVTGEMSWALGGAPGADRLLEYESKVARFFARKLCVALCQYNHRRFPPEVLLGVIRTHGLVVWGGAVCRNVYYAPPQEFLKPWQPAREVARLLRSIGTRQQTEEALRKSLAALERSRGQLRALAASLVRSQEEERRRLSEELQEDLNQGVAMLAVEVEALRQRLHPSDGWVRKELGSLKDRIVELSEGLHRVTHQLHPSSLEDLGLGPTLKSYCAELSSRGPVRVSFRAADLSRNLPKEVALCLYRVAQEALRNVTQHSGAQSASVRLSRNRQGICLSVTDRGAGFEPDSAQPRGGLGLLRMEERTRQAGGSLTVKSRPGKGTRVEAHIPLPSQAA